MRAWRKAARVAGLIAALAFTVRPARAASSATISIDVTILANLSVEVSGSASSTQAATWDAATPNAKLVSPSTATVTNTSGGLTEKWALAAGANSIAQAGTDNWSLAASSSSVGPDQFAVQAVFGSSNTTAGNCPDASSTTWNASYAPALSASPVNYTSSVFAAATLDEGGGTPNPDITGGAANGRMHAASRRALCWRVITPSSTSTAENQNIQIIVTAVAP